ncbi:hypothetical protein IscW_ISCW002958, partial [Ixodes scapularis]
NKNPKFKMDDIVRLRKYKKVFEKGYKQNYTNEVFRIKEVFSDLYYCLGDIKGEDILGMIYEQD